MRLSLHAVAVLLALPAAADVVLLDEYRVPEVVIVETEAKRSTGSKQVIHNGTASGEVSALSQSTTTAPSVRFSGSTRV